MNKALLHFEQATGLGPTKAARLLGVAYVTYAQVRSGARPLQKYHARHMEVILLLPPAALRKLIQEHVHGDN
jgi:hypothetical protein